MPAFVIAKSGPADAMLCDPGRAGSPDRRNATTVYIPIINDRALSGDDEPRGIILCTGQNGTTTFLVDGSTRRVRIASGALPWRRPRRRWSNWRPASGRLSRVLKTGNCD